MHNDAANGRWLHFGNDEFYVAIQQNADHEKKRDISYKHDGMNHLGFVVTELESILNRLTEAGYAISEASGMLSHPYRRRVYLFDGNGFEREFVEYRSSAADQRNDYSV